MIEGSTANRLPPTGQHLQGSGPTMVTRAPGLHRRAGDLLAMGMTRLRRAGDLWYITAATVVNVANFAFFGLVGHLLHPSAYGAVARARASFWPSLRAPLTGNRGFNGSRVR